MAAQDLVAPEKLKSHHCVPCEGGVQPLRPEEYAVYLPQVQEWHVQDEKALVREFVFKTFRQAIAFIDAVAVIAEAEGHHPDLLLHGYKHVRVTLSTHVIGGLSVNDFVLAVKIDMIPAPIP